MVCGAADGGGLEDVLVVESRKINGVFRRAERAEWDALLAGLFEEVEGR